jgi:hypothetical protein
MQTRRVGRDEAHHEPALAHVQPGKPMIDLELLDMTTISISVDQEIVCEDIAETQGDFQYREADHLVCVAGRECIPVIRPQLRYIKESIITISGPARYQTS